MRKILSLLTVILILGSPVLGNINQKADLDGGNVIVVKVNQIAWNYGSGDINQNVNVRIAGNLQMAQQDSVVFIPDPDYAGNINSTLKGINLIKLDLDQFANNYASGNISQGIEVTIEGNMNILDQGVMIIV